MRRDLIYTSTKDMSREQWLAWRRNAGVGGSEGGTTMGLNEHSDRVRLFYDKLGLVDWQEDNEVFYSGRVMEDVVVDKFWKYWDPEDPTPDKMIANAAKDNVVRKSRRTNFIIQNEKYPHLFANPDRTINAEGKKGEGNLEVKTAMGFMVNKWESAIPPSYIVQQQIYLAVTDLSWGEFALLKDGRFFTVIPFERDEEMIGQISSVTEVFWEKVLLGREIIASKLSKDEETFELGAIEPSPTNHKDFEALLKERYRDNDKILLADNNMFLLHKDYWNYQEQEKKFKGLKLEATNGIKSLLTKNSCNVMFFEEGIQTTYKPDAKGLPRLYPAKKIKDMETFEK